MLSLAQLTELLDGTWDIRRSSPDLVFSRIVPNLYQPRALDISSLFEPDFCARFNGLMLRGSDRIDRAFCAAFPTPEVINAALRQNASDVATCASDVQYPFPAALGVQSVDQQRVAAIRAGFMRIGRVGDRADSHVRDYPRFELYWQP